MKRFHYLLLVLTCALLALGVPGTSSAAGSKLTTYTSPDGLWSVQYPADLLHVEKLNPEVMLFISKDRHTFAAVNTVMAGADAYGGGTDGSILAGIGNATLEQIYAKRLKSTSPIKSVPAPFEVGLTFTTDKGSVGAAVYEQRGRKTANFRINGFLYGYKAADEKAMLPVLQAIRASYTIKQANTGIEQAASVLNQYFTALHDGRYNDAAKLYGGSYAMLAGWNPKVPANQPSQLFAAGCTHQVNCLNVSRIAGSQVVSANKFSFTVEFKHDDGSILEVRACCDKNTPPNSQFQYTVQRIGNQLKVMELPVYSA